MGALTSNRNSYSRSSEFVPVSKKPRTCSESNTHSKSTSSILSRYPEVTTWLKREVHAPCRVRKFGFSMGNSINKRYDWTKNRALDSLQYFKKEEPVNDVGLEDYGTKNLGLEEYRLEVNRHELITGQNFQDAHNEFFENQEKNEFFENQEKNDSKIVESGFQPSSSVVTECNGPVMLLNRYADEPFYKKLWKSTEKGFPRIKEVNFQIQFHESCLSLFQLTRPPKKPVEDTGKIDEAFVPLTKEEEDVVSRAFLSQRRTVLVTHDSSNITIMGDQFQCLRPGAWLNDEVINVYLELLKEREKRDPKKFLKCHFFNTFFYKKLIGGKNGYDYKSVKRWTTQRKLGYSLIECDKIFVPVHKEVHWCLAVINIKGKKIQYLDSLGGVDTRVIKVLATYIADEAKDKSGMDIDISAWEHEHVDDLPEQKNGSDCGVFMIKYADFYSRGIELCFKQENMPYFRQRTANEILSLRAE